MSRDSGQCHGPALQEVHTPPRLLPGAQGVQCSPWEGLLPPQPAGARRQTQTLPDDSHAQSVRVSVLPEDSFPGDLGFFFSVLSLTRNLKLKVEKHAREITSHQIHSWCLTCQIKYLGGLPHENKKHCLPSAHGLLLSKPRNADIALRLVCSRRSPAAPLRGCLILWPLSQESLKDLQEPQTVSIRKT